jgi:hypothetical protein
VVQAGSPGSGGTTTPWQVVQKPSPLLVNVRTAVNAGGTVTLPAAGAGVFHYITAIQIRKLYNVVGVAAGAGVNITTTNLPGGLQFLTEQNASPAGTVALVVDLELNSPIKSSVANTATTVVAPAQLQTIWDMNVWYYAE